MSLFRIIKDLIFLVIIILIAIPLIVGILLHQYLVEMRLKDMIKNLAESINKNSYYQTSLELDFENYEIEFNFTNNKIVLYRCEQGGILYRKPDKTPNLGVSPPLGNIFLVRSLENCNIIYEREVSGLSNLKIKIYSVPSRSGNKARIGIVTVNNVFGISISGLSKILGAITQVKEINMDSSFSDGWNLLGTYIPVGEYSPKLEVSINNIICVENAWDPIKCRFLFQKSLFGIGNPYATIEYDGQGNLNIFYTI